LAVNYLSQYLEEFLANRENLQDEHWNNIHWGWAIQALVYLDRQKGNYYFKKYHFAKREIDRSYLNSVCPSDDKLVFRKIEVFCNLYFT